MFTWASVGFPLMVVFLVFIFTIGDKRNPDHAAFQFAKDILAVGAFFLPFYLVLSITLLGFIENRSQGWKLMYSQPVGRGYYYVSKLFFLFLVVVMVFFFKFIFSSIAIYFIELSKPQYKVTEFLSVWTVFLVPELKIILSCFTLIAFQYWLSIRAKNFILPFGIGVFAAILPLAVFIILGIAGIISSPGKLIHILRFDPYSLPFSFVFDFAGTKSIATIVEIPKKFVIASMASGIVIGTIAFLDMRRRNIQ
jgi:lantibiotic transport system permease protein